MIKGRIHIVHVIPSLAFGGAERFLIDLVNHSDPKRFWYSIILFFDDMPLGKELTSKVSSIKIIPKKGKISRGLFKQLRGLYRNLEADVVHTHLFGGDFWGRIAAHQMGIPVITTEHGFNQHEGRLKHLVRWYLKNYSDYYTAPSKVLKDYMVKRYGIRKPIDVIPHGIELKRFESIPPLASIKPLRFVIIGRLVKQKGHDVALRALATLKDFSWHLDIVGEGEEKKQLERISLALGIGERVRFLPPTEHIPRILQDAHVLLVPSRTDEGFGIVAMEGMAAGRLVIASAAGGLKEVVRNGKNGLLVPPGDVEGLKKKLLWCFEEGNELKRLAKDARKFAATYFDIDTVVKEYEDIYLKLAPKRPLRG